MKFTTSPLNLIFALLTLLTLTLSAAIPNPTASDLTDSITESDGPISRSIVNAYDFVSRRGHQDSCGSSPFQQPCPNGAMGGVVGTKGAAMAGLIGAIAATALLL